jgi:hypothetical protein
MTTPPKYHDLVLLDESNREGKYSDGKKIFFIFSLFFLGVVVGAVIISLLHGGDMETQAAINPLSISKSNDSISVPQEIVPTTLQPIAAVNDPTPNALTGCSIESLGRNTVEQGCAVDDYKEDVTGVTGLDNLNSLGNNADKTKTLENDGVTNILDLQ